jgi:transposase
METFPANLFMQDGAGVHRAQAVTEFLDCHHINTIDWPPYSPDLSPIDILGTTSRGLCTTTILNSTIGTKLQVNGRSFVRL